MSFDFPGSGKEGHEFNGLEPKIPPFWKGFIKSAIPKDRPLF